MFKFDINLLRGIPLNSTITSYSNCYYSSCSRMCDLHILLTVSIKNFSKPGNDTKTFRNFSWRKASYFFIDLRRETASRLLHRRMYKYIYLNRCMKYIDLIHTAHILKIAEWNKKMWLHVHNDRFLLFETWRWACPKQQLCCYLGVFF